MSLEVLEEIPTTQLPQAAEPTRVLYPAYPETASVHTPVDTTVMPEFNPDGSWTISGEIDDDHRLLALLGWVVGGTIGLTALGVTLDALLR